MPNGELPMEATIRMEMDKVCKGSVRYKAAEPKPGEPKPAATNVYVEKTFAAKMPAAIEVTIRAV